MQIRTNDLKAALLAAGNCWYWCNGRLAVVIMPQRTINPKTGYQLERLQ